MFLCLQQKMKTNDTVRGLNKDSGISKVSGRKSAFERRVRQNCASQRSHHGRCDEPVCGAYVREDGMAALDLSQCVIGDD